jgi:hypothetical protein
MRTKLDITKSSNMFGHSYGVITKDGAVQLVDNLENDWMIHQRQRITRPFYWFRAPSITRAQLAQTMQSLSELDGACQLVVWEDHKGNLDASIKFKSEADTAMFAWSHTEMWAKWSDAEEKQLVDKLKVANKTLKVSKHGTVKVTVETSHIPD